MATAKAPRSTRRGDPSENGQRPLTRDEFFRALKKIKKEPAQVKRPKTPD